MSLINPELLEVALRPLVEKVVEEKLEAFKKDYIEKILILNQVFGFIIL